MHDEPHVRPIDPHAERDRRDDDVCVLVEEHLLMTAADLVGQPRVVRDRAAAFALQPCGELFDLAARLAVHDPGLAVVPREDVEQLPPQRAAPQHAIRQVRPIEGSDEDERIAQPELADNVAPDALGRRRRERVERHRRELLAQPSQLPVLRPEIVAPLADAVRLVDRDETQARLLQHAPQRLAALADDALRRHVEQPAAAVAHAREHLVALVRQERAVQIRGGDAVDAKPVDLILHQRNQRRDDEREARIDDRRRLEAERFAAAGRQDDDAVARIEDRVHRLALQRAERRVAPDALQRLAQRVVGGRALRAAGRRRHAPPTPSSRTSSRRTRRPAAGIPTRARRTTRAAS